MVKLVDALDSKSSGPRVRVGSIPTSGTKFIHRVAENLLLSVAYSPKDDLNPYCLKMIIVILSFKIKIGYNCS